MGDSRGAHKVVVRRHEESYHLGIVVKITLKWIFKKRWRAMNCIHVAQVRDRWCALVNAVMNLRVP
jgi:hypothetical protein